jgi:hypothetical protein
MVSSLLHNGVAMRQDGGSSTSSKRKRGRP